MAKSVVAKYSTVLFNRRIAGHPFNIFDITSKHPFDHVKGPNGKCEVRVSSALLYVPSPRTLWPLLCKAHCRYELTEVKGYWLANHTRLYHFPCLDIYWRESELKDRHQNHSCLISSLLKLSYLFYGWSYGHLT